MWPSKTISQFHPWQMRLTEGWLLGVLKSFSQKTKITFICTKTFSNILYTERPAVKNVFVAFKNDFLIPPMKNASDGGVTFGCAKNIFPKTSNHFHVHKNVFKKIVYRKACSQKRFCVYESDVDIFRNDLLVYTKTISRN